LVALPRTATQALVDGLPVRTSQRQEEKQEKRSGKKHTPKHAA
jgi:hypothetical protein